MRLYRSAIFIFLLLIVALTYLSSQIEAAPPEVELAGRFISLDLVTDDDELTLTAWPSEQVSLDTDTVIVKKEDNITALLKGRGIRPDAESYTLVYDLNPKLDKVDPLPVGASLRLPKINGGNQLRQELARGRIVMITVDKRLKDKLRSNVEAIASLSPRFAALESSRFVNSGRKQETIKYVQELAAWFEHMQKTFFQRTAKPVRRVTLLQIVDESDILRLIFEQVLAPGQELGREKQEQIQALYKDIVEMIGKWDDVMAGELPSGEPQYKVVVEIRGNDPNKIKSFRVYYVVAGLFRTPIVNPPVRSANFNDLGSGSSATLPIKDYKVWAAQDGDPANPLTPVADLKVRKPATEDPIKLVLSIRP